MNILFKVILPVSVHREDGLFVSFCPVLDVMSQGKTDKEAIHNLIEATQAFLLSCYERGTLDQVLKDCGFQPITRANPSPVTEKKSMREIIVDLPFYAPTKGHLEHCPA